MRPLGFVVAAAFASIAAAGSRTRVRQVVACGLTAVARRVGRASGRLPEVSDEHSPTTAAPRRERDELQGLRDAAWFSATLDLDAVALRVLEAAVAACEADGGGIALRRSHAGSQVVHMFNLTERERRWLSAALSEADGVSATLRFRFGRSEQAPLVSAVLASLPGHDGEAVGVLTALWRRERRDLADEQALVEAVAASATDGVENARTFDRLWSELDALRRQKWAQPESRSSAGGGGRAG